MKPTAAFLTSRNGRQLPVKPAAASAGSAGVAALQLFGHHILVVFVYVVPLRATSNVIELEVSITSTTSTEAVSDTESATTVVLGMPMMPRKANRTGTCATILTSFRRITPLHSVLPGCTRVSS